MIQNRREFVKVSGVLGLSHQARDVTGSGALRSPPPIRASSESKRRRRRWSWSMRRWASGRSAR